MARPVTGKIMSCKVRVKKKNGDVYVYERRSRYDPKKGYSVPCGSTLIGKYINGEGKMVPTRPRRRPGTGASKPESVRKRVGAAEIMEWAGRGSGVDDDIKKAFKDDPGMALKIISMARYCVMSGGGPVSGIEIFLQTHVLPYPEALSYQTCLDAMDWLGRDEKSSELRLKFFKARAGRILKGEGVAFDSTTLSTYSKGINAARPGHSKEGTDLPVVKLLTLYGMQTRQPVAFTIREGNLSDVKSLGTALAAMGVLKISIRQTVTDSGYCSEENLKLMCESHVKFLTASSGSGWIGKCEDKALGKLSEYSTGLDGGRNQSEHGVRFTVMHSFTEPEEGKAPAEGKASEPDKPAGAKAAKESEEQKPQENKEDVKDREKKGGKTAPKRLYVYVYRTDEKLALAKKNLDSRIRDDIAVIESGRRDSLSASEKRFCANMLKVTQGRGSVHAAADEDKYAAELKRLGVFSLVSNRPASVDDALEMYRMRERIEEAFADEKGMDTARPRVWSDEALRGRLLVRFVALCYVCFIRQRLRELKDSLGKKTGDPEHDKAANLSAELAALKWLNRQTLASLLRWFDAREEIKVDTHECRTRWCTESTKRDQLILEKLGVRTAA